MGGLGAECQALPKYLKYLSEHGKVVTHAGSRIRRTP